MINGYQTSRDFDVTPSGSPGPVCEPVKDGALSPLAFEERGAILVISNGQQNLEVLRDVSEDWDLRVLNCSTVGEALEVLANVPVLMVFCDLRGTNSGFDGLLRLISVNQHARIVGMIPESMDESAYRAAMQMGAFNVIASPCRPSDVKWTILFALRDDDTSNDSHET